MATANKEREISTVGELKKFLEDIPDETPVRGCWDDEPVTAYLWHRDDFEIIEPDYVTIENE